MLYPGGYNSTLYEKREHGKFLNQVGGWSFNDIRYCNYFFENAVPKYEAGQVSGSAADIEHYIGENAFHACMDIL